jgi:hypothetical protein
MYVPTEDGKNCGNMQYVLMIINYHMYEWLWTRFALVIGFTEHFHTQLVTTLYRSRSHTEYFLLQSPLTVVL